MPILSEPCLNLSKQAFIPLSFPHMWHQSTLVLVHKAALIPGFTASFFCYCSRYRLPRGVGSDASSPARAQKLFRFRLTFQPQTHENRLTLILWLTISVLHLARSVDCDPLGVALQLKVSVQSLWRSRRMICFWNLSLMTLNCITSTGLSVNQNLSNSYSKYTDTEGQH